MGRFDTFLRLSFCARRKLLYSSTYQSIRYKTNLLNNVQSIAASDDDQDVKIDDFREKILYNTLLHGEKYTFEGELKRRKRERYEHMNKLRNSVPTMSVLAQHLHEQAHMNDDKLSEEETDTETAAFDLPFQKINSTIKQRLNDDRRNNTIDTAKDRGWMKNYEHFDYSAMLKPNESDLIHISEDDIYDSELNRMTDPNSEVSTVPCGGCGAHLHCKDESIPGYLPVDLFKKRKRAELSSMICQRCYFLNEYNVALNLSVGAEDYVELLTKIKDEHALAIIMVDLLDFPCSIWPGIMDIIGTKRPVIIVGNKVDLLPADSKKYLKNILQCLESCIKQTVLKDAKIKHIELISAKTGYGIEKLINKLHKIWRYNGDVYLIGCTNVGKSTLFNALLQSDYCKVQAVDLLQRATVNQWPGTTLNLLKFPILRPARWRLALRVKRLNNEKLEEEALAAMSENKGKIFKPLIGKVGRTFFDPKNQVDEETVDPFSYTMQSGFRSSPLFGINENDRTYANSKWFYDTPGVLHPDQILSLLTVDELLMTIPKELIKPRTYRMKSGHTLFIAGLARIDLIECEDWTLFTVFASGHLPVTVCETVDASDLYASLLGSKYLGVPVGDPKRLENWPNLEHDREQRIKGTGGLMSSKDVVLASAGWVSIATEQDKECVVLPWTPHGRGVHFREPILPYAVRIKGRRIAKTPAYNVLRPIKK